MERRNHNRAGLMTTRLTNAQITTLKANYAKDLNIYDRITKFSNQLQNEHVYRIPLRYFSDIGKINFLTKIDYRIKLFLESDMKKLAKSKNVLAAGTGISTPDVQIIFTKAPYIQYEQILLDKNFRQYLETIMVSKKILRKGTQKTPMQKTYEINTGQDFIDEELLGANKQFDWLEISLVHDKHTTICDSYNREMADQNIKSSGLTTFTEVYRLTNEKQYDVDNLTHRHLLWKQFVAWHCNGSSVAPIVDYINNPIFPELPDEDEYYSEKSDEKNISRFKSQIWIC